MRILYSLILVSVLVVAPSITQAAPEITVNGNPVDTEAIQQRVDETRTQVQETVRKTQCETLVSRQTITVNRFNDRMNRIEEQIQNRQMRTEEHRKDADIVQQEIREESQDRRNDIYKNLEDIAETDEQRVAVNTFKQTNETAVTKRQKAIDNARDDYRKTMDTIVANYEADALKPYERYVSASKIALDNAISQCKNGTELVKLRADLRKNLSDAGQQFRSERANTMTDAQTDRKDAQQVYRGAINDAWDVYEEELQTALDELQKVLDIDSITITIEL